MPFVVTPTTGVDQESWTLDGLALHDATFRISVEGVDMTPPRQKPEWIGAADSEYQALVRDPLYENRILVIPMMIAEQTTKDQVFDMIGQIRDKLAEASKHPDGIVLTWTARGSARTINFDVLAGEITELPLDFQLSVRNRARLTITLTCKPFWYGTETLTSTTSSSTPFVTAEIVNSIGDVPALGRLIITDTATQSRRHVEWGLEGPLTYDPATSLLIDSDDMITSGFGGTQATLSGAYDPNASGNSAIWITAQSAATAMCGTGNLSHIGAFRVKARVWADLATTQVRLSWRAGDGPLSSNAWADHSGGSAWWELDLGMVTIPAVTAGTQRWTGQIEARARTSSGTSTVWVDYLVLMPVTAGYGKARAIPTGTAGAVVAYDNFTSTTSGANLNGGVAPAGGTWATSGAATDFQFADSVGTNFYTSEAITRATLNDASRRFAILGSTNYTDTEVASRTMPYNGSSVCTSELGVFARWVDSSNYLTAYLKYDRTAPGVWAYTLVVEQIVAGVTTTLASEPAATVGSSNQIRTRLIVYTSGLFFADLLFGETARASATGTSSVLATGGALDDGKAGILDRSINTSAVTASTRVYDEFQVSVPAAEPIVIYSGRNMQVRHDDTIRQDSTGTYTGRPALYMPAGRFLVQVGTSRVLVKARRNDVDSTTDPNVTDATQIQVGVTPRGLAVPRA